MKKRVRLSDNQRVDIVVAYEEQLTPMIDLGVKYGVSRQAIYKVLKQAGVDTSKGMIPVSCCACGEETMRGKASLRRLNHVFCSRPCYTSWLQAGNGHPYIETRQGQRIARTIVEQHFALQWNHIVHHEDRNQYNNQLNNLRVFANQGDHVRHHRDCLVVPVWDGRYL